VTPAAHREAAAYLQQTYEMSQRRACRVIDGDRASVRCQARRPDDGELRERLKALAQERRRFGYRRLHVLLRREGHAVNKKRVQRLYREERLMVRQRGGRKRAMGTRRPIETPAVANQRWSLDFVADQFTDGRRFRILEVDDDCTRECLALVADTSIGGRRVARALDAIIGWRGKPATIVSDNGTELTSNAILEWADQRNIGWRYIADVKLRRAPARTVLRFPPSVMGLRSQTPARYELFGKNRVRWINAVSLTRPAAIEGWAGPALRETIYLRHHPPGDIRDPTSSSAQRL